MLELERLYRFTLLIHEIHFLLLHHKNTTNILDLSFPTHIYKNILFKHISEMIYFIIIESFTFLYDKSISDTLLASSCVAN